MYTGGLSLVIAIGKVAGKHVVLEEYAAPTAGPKEQYMLLW